MKPSERIRELFQYYMDHRNQIPADMTAFNMAIIKYLDEQALQQEEEE